MIIKLLPSEREHCVNRKDKKMQMFTKDYLSEALYYAYYIFFANMISFRAADSNTCPGKYVMIKQLILLK